MALHPGAGIVARLLIGALGDRDALHPDQQPLAVHHREHAFETAIFLADAPADRAVTLAVGHDAGRRGVDAELFLDPQRPQIVALAGLAVAVGQEFRHQEQRDAAAARRRVRGARQHHVDDVVGQVVVAVGDEDLLAADPVVLAPALVRAGTARVRRAPRSEPACGSVRFIVPVHSPETSFPR